MLPYIKLIKSLCKAMPVVIKSLYRIHVFLKNTTPKLGALKMGKNRLYDMMLIPFE